MYERNRCLCGYKTQTTNPIQAMDIMLHPLVGFEEPDQSVNQSAYQNFWTNQSA